MVFNMFHGTLQPLAGAARTLSQLAEDGLLPRILGRRSRTDAPLGGDAADRGHGDRVSAHRRPGLADRRREPHLPDRDLPAERRGLAAAPQRAGHARGRIARRAARSCSASLAAGVWGVSTVLGFQQFGLPTVLVGIGARLLGLGALRLARIWRDRRAPGLPRLRALAAPQADRRDAARARRSTAPATCSRSTHVDHGRTALVAALEDIFVAVALLTITVGLVLPGMIAHAVGEVAEAADRLATGTLADLTRAMQALGRGDLEAAHARVDIEPRRRAFARRGRRTWPRAST